MKSIIFTFAKRCLLLGILFFALLGFQGKANASEVVHWAEDFRTNYNVGDGKAQIDSKSENYPYISVGSNNVIKYFDGISGLGCNSRPGADFIFESPVNVFNALDADAYSITFNVKANLLQNLDSWWSISADKSGIGAGAGASFKFLLADNTILFRLFKEGAFHTFTYDTDGDTFFNVKLELNSLLLLNIYINGTLVVDSFDQSLLGGYYDVDYIRLVPSNNDGASNLIFNDFALTSGSPSEPYLWRDWCGSDAGKLIETTPVNLCDVGTAGTVSFDGSKWSWDCIDGVVSQSCRAYLATTEPVNGTCGDWNGETFDTWPPLTELCELRTSLVIPSMVETINGYTWTCSGINGGTSDYCSGNKTSPPLMPELPAGSLDDCSGLSILEGLVCKMGNTLKTIFLPSSEKINELNQTINKMASKFPFSYISKATETFNDVKGNITETSMLELSIMGSEKSSIDFSTIAFFDYIKMLTTILIVLVFSFWLIRFIKHIF
jgi:hypothetical protein